MTVTQAISMYLPIRIDINYEYNKLNDIINITVESA